MTNRPAPEILAPKWTNEQIIAAAGRLGADFENVVGREHIQSYGLRFEDVYEKLIFPRFGVSLYEDVDLGTDEHGTKILGTYKIAENAAYLDACLHPDRHDARRVFTLYHEVAGHGALHGDWLRKQTGIDDAIQVSEYSLSPMAERRLERQANLFAAHLSAPDWLIDFAIRRTFGRSISPFFYNGPCMYCLTTGISRRNYVANVWDLCGWIGSLIDQYFGGLSGEALGYRIAECGWINDRTGLLERNERQGEAWASAFRRDLYRHERPARAG